MPTTINSEQVDTELSRVFEKQICFKDKTFMRIAACITRAALQANGAGIWPDDSAILSVVEKLRPEDKNLVGSAWRVLGKVKIIERGQARRRSTSKAAKGTEIAQWHLCSHTLARAFLRRNELNHEPDQKELF